MSIGSLIFSHSHVYSRDKENILNYKNIRMEDLKHLDIEVFTSTIHLTMLLQKSYSIMNCELNMNEMESESVK